MSLFNDSTTTSSATTSANTPCDLWTQTINGGAIPASNGMTITAEGQVYEGTGGFMVTLNGVTLFDEGADVGVHTMSVELLVWRTGNTTGSVIGTLRIGSDVYGVPAKSLTGLDWTHAQTLKVQGKSSVTGGVILERAGVQR